MERSAVSAKVGAFWVFCDIKIVHTTTGGSMIYFRSWRKLVIGFSNIYINILDCSNKNNCQWEMKIFVQQRYNKVGGLKMQGPSWNKYNFRLWKIWKKFQANPLTSALQSHHRCTIFKRYNLTGSGWIIYMWLIPATFCVKFSTCNLWDQRYR